jgi:EAL domain-containing protein (putative c-di-GMP-specific phosphodiesterase class I)/CheY-like chemotaxis protein
MMPRILLVDDEPNLLTALRRRLVSRFTISCANNGAEALQLLENEGQFAVVVSDMRMPVMDGLTLLREVHRRWPATIRMMLSGQADFETVVAAVNSGGLFQFHLKPVRPDVLCKSIERAILQHQLFLRSPALPADCRQLIDDVADLRHAIAAGQLRLHLQPQLRFRDGRIVGAEALLRWQHPERGLLPPGSFFDLIEVGGLMSEVTAWVLDAACARIRSWQDQGLDTLRLAANVTTSDIIDPCFQGRVEAALARHDIPRGLLELELTEQAALADPPRSRATIADVAKLGVRWTIDDFGTGYASFGWLRRLPVNKLKIDRSFVEGIDTDPSACRLVKGLVEIAGDLGLEVVAEGARRGRLRWRGLR